MLIPRKEDYRQIQQLLDIFPITAILGPRQCGKTTLANLFKYNHYFDLENPRDIVRLENPQLTLEDLSGLIVIDEIQRIPDIFPLLRYLVDNNKTQKYLILGSASRELIKHSSETLAGRIGYHLLEGFRLSDLKKDSFKDLWLRGGLPRSFLASSTEKSLIWRNNYISTFLERDLPQLGINIPTQTMKRFWLMLTHYHGQIINFSELGRAFGISDTTVRRYIEILEGTYMINILQPWFTNTSKRLVKSPKLYFTDSGILHALENITSIAELESNIKLGASWEGFALQAVIGSLGKQTEVFFWRTHAGAEIDLTWKAKGLNWGIEFKYQDAPKLNRSLKVAQEDLQLNKIWVIYPGKQSYQLDKSITVLSIFDLPINWIYS